MEKVIHRILMGTGQNTLERDMVKDSWLDIIGRYLHLQTEEIKTDGKIINKEQLIFPVIISSPAFVRFQHMRKNTVLENYLIQHSAGSGKSIQLHGSPIGFQSSQ